MLEYFLRQCMLTIITTRTAYKILEIDRRIEQICLFMDGIRTTDVYGRYRNKYSLQAAEEEKSRLTDLKIKIYEDEINGMTDCI